MGFFFKTPVPNAAERTPLRRSPSFLCRLPGYSGQVSGQAPIQNVRPTLLRSAISSGPETHIRVFQLQERGLRFNNPETGRWISRDPLGDESFFQTHFKGMSRSEHKKWRQRSLLPAYIFVQNNSVIFIDPVGLDLSHSGCQQCCPEIVNAVQRVNNALGAGTCKEWFAAHGHDYSAGNPSRSIACYGNGKIACMLGFSAWTMPGMGIGVCSSKCAELGGAGLASILIHELAHHYCTWGPGREDCAMSAQDACFNAVINQ